MSLGFEDSLSSSQTICLWIKDSLGITDFRGLWNCQQLKDWKASMSLTLSLGLNHCELKVGKLCYFLM